MEWGQCYKDEKPEAFGARMKAKSLREDFEGIIKKLKTIREALVTKIEKDNDSLTVRPPRWDGEMPAGFRFKHIGMMFYVECGVTRSQDADSLDGLITYGVSRPKCFDRCPIEGETTKQEELNAGQKKAAKERRYGCERNDRCDHREDKPLFMLRVSRYGVIKDVPGIQGSWASDKSERIIDLHYRVLEQIWKDALDWFNENMTV